ncbi:MAG TPA: class I SAM-dependent methyltransferase [Candidatus Saccharimonadia bacterium]
MLILLVLIIIAATFSIASFVGAPYVPILRRDSEALLSLADLKPGQTLIDLGSGDGRLLRAAAARGIRGIGYEINPIMIAISRLVCWRYRHLITIHLADFWQTKLPPADVVYVFLLPKYMLKLDQHLANQIHQPTRLISYAFEIPDKPSLIRTRNTFVYEYGTQIAAPSLNN